MSCHNICTEVYFKKELVLARMLFWMCLHQILSSSSSSYISISHNPIFGRWLLPHRLLLRLLFPLCRSVIIMIMSSSSSSESTWTLEFCSFGWDFNGEAKFEIFLWKWRKSRQKDFTSYLTKQKTFSLHIFSKIVPIMKLWHDSVLPRLLCSFFVAFLPVADRQHRARHQSFWWFSSDNPPPLSTHSAVLAFRAHFCRVFWNIVCWSPTIRTH